MADASLSKGKVSRKLVPYAGIALLIVASIGFLMQMGSNDEGKDLALKNKEEIELLRGQGSSEEAARLEIVGKEEEIKKEIEARQKELPRTASPTAPSESLLPPPRFGDDSMRAYEAARAAAAPSSKERMSMVAYEEFPGTKGIIGPFPQEQSSPPSGDRAGAHGSARGDTDKQIDEDDRNRAWAAKTDGRIKAETSAFLQPEVLAVKSVLLQGTIINAVTRTAINTKLPGQIVASVSQDVYDSIHGETLLLPKGSQLIGEYNTAVMDGQDRVMMAFTRLVFPSGASVRLGAMSASDALGVAGAKGKVNTYFFKRLGSSLMLALLASTIKSPESVTLVNAGEKTGSATAAGDVLSKSADQELKRSSNITPDIYLSHGSKVSLILAADLALPPSITSQLPLED
jgi:type IV secretory pathway VirB10-like protein